MALPKVPENNDDLIDEIKDSRSIAVKSGQLLQRLVGFESTKLKEAREERRENKRKKDRGAVGSAMFGKIKGDKGKGIFGLIGSMGKMLGGGLMKTLGPMWKVLKILFKADSAEATPFNESIITKVNAIILIILIFVLLNS